MRSVFESRLNDNRYNTSYPLSPSDWNMYETDGHLPFPVKDICFYLHIPFCKRLCSFCEYTRMSVPDEALQLQYIATLRRDIFEFLTNHPNITLHGFDIGGGTPTALSDIAFEELLQLYADIVAKVNIAVDFEPSIEATTRTLTAQKLKRIAGNGIGRLSMGLQTTDVHILNDVNRNIVDFNNIATAIKALPKVNLDLMYGLPGQSVDKTNRDISVLSNIRPAQVTLYEYRTNQLHSQRQLDANTRYDIYCRFYEALTDMGYYARFGQNTFSLDQSDFGVSSYLRNRMLNGMAYKGFGISAQSMSEVGLSYNIGKNASNLPDLILRESYEPPVFYKLPQTELLNKFISISAYSGGFSLSRASEFLEADFQMAYADIIDILKTDKLIYIEDDRLQVTHKGFRHYGAVFSMFTVKQ